MYEGIYLAFIRSLCIFVDTVKPGKLKHPQGHKICSNNQCVFDFTRVTCPLLTFCIQAKLDSVNLFNVVHLSMPPTFQCTVHVMTSLSYQSSLSKEIIKLYDLYPDNSIKKRKQIYRNACF